MFDRENAMCGVDESCGHKVEKYGITLIDLIEKIEVLNILHQRTFLRGQSEKFSSLAQCCCSASLVGQKSVELEILLK